MSAQINPTSPEPITQQGIPARDRLLTALSSAPRLSDEDAQQINKAIQEARGLRLPTSQPFNVRCATGEQKKETRMTTLDRITIDPARMNGQPCVRDLRLTVRRVLEAMATFPDREELQREYPEIEPEDIRQALAYAAANLDDRSVILTAA